MTADLINSAFPDILSLMVFEEIGAFATLTLEG